ncbi:MAG: Aca2/YdiL-like domain-containing protein [Canibacter sp.]
MNSAEFKTLRELTGLSMNEAATLFSVSLRSWERWESPSFTGKHHENITDDLRDIIRTFEIQTNTLLEALDQMIDEIGERPENVTLTRYRTDDALKRHHPEWRYPRSVHDAMVRWQYEALLAEGHEPLTVWDDDARATVGSDIS